MMRTKLSACADEVCIFRPATAFVLELLMAIFSCVVVGCMTRYFLALLGEPPMPQELLRRAPRRAVRESGRGEGLTWVLLWDGNVAGNMWPHIHTRTHKKEDGC